MCIYSVIYIYIYKSSAEWFAEEMGGRLDFIPLRIGVPRISKMYDCMICSCFGLSKFEVA